MVVEANVAIMQGLYNNWSINNPGKDTVGWTDPSGNLHTLDTNDPSRVYFTTRAYRYAPVGKHTFQISVRRQPEQFQPASPSVPTQYLARKGILIDVWILTGPQQSIETAEASYFNIMQEIKRIIRAQNSAFGNNILSVVINNISADEGALFRNPPRIHARIALTATLYEIQLPLLLPTLTRGVGWRDDMISASLWTLDSGVSLTSDGDIGTLSGTTSTNGASQTVPGSLNSSTYPRLLCRAASGDTTTRTLDILVNYTVGSDTFTMTGVGTPFQVFNFTLTSGKTISSVKFQNQSVSGNLLVDFIFPFKELLVLPAVFEPLRPIKNRRVAVLPILGREGGILQDLGSVETDLSITGGLLQTTQYSANDWWHVFDGLVLEAGTFQADGNETWQWFASDLVTGKFFPVSWVPGQVMGRIAYHDYTLSLKRFDVIGETAAMIGAIQ